MSRRSQLLVELLLTLLAIGSGQRADAAIVAFWSGNGNANDSVAGRDGTLVNGAGFGAGQFAQQAFQLNGVNQYVSVPDSPAWDFGNNAFTIALWVNFDAISTRPSYAGGNVLIGHDDGGGTQNKWFLSYLADGSLLFHLNGPAVQNINLPLPSGVSGTFLTSPNALAVQQDTWNLFALTRDGSTYTFFENGTSLGSVSDSQSIPVATAPLTIGQIEGAGFLAGRMQNVQIYDQALSQDQISQLDGAVPEPTSMAVWALCGLIAVAVSLCCRRASDGSIRNSQSTYPLSTIPL
jgi:hypothetical protein